MSDKHYIGLDITSFEDSGASSPVSRVTLFLDDDTCYTAGDDTGREITAKCPWATQEMANRILSSIKGHRNRIYSAGSAGIDPAAELGDGVTVGGIYSTLSSIDDDGSGYPDLSSPGEAELVDEYPPVGQTTRDFQRKIAATRAIITKTSEEIRLEVSSELDSLSSSISAKLQSITTSVQGLDGRISTVEQTASGLTTTVQGITGEINTIKQTIQGVVYESSLADGTTVINGGCLMTNSVSADRLILTGSITFDDLTADLQALVSDTGPDLPNYIRRTYIASTEIRSPTITGNEIRALGSFQVGTGSADNFTGTGYMGYAEGLGAGDTVTKGVAISNSATLASGAGNNYVIVTDGGIRGQVGTNHAYLTPDVYSLLVGDHELRLTNAGVLTLDGNSIGSAGEDVTVTPVWG